jgi:hypothetical protein
VLRNVDGQRVSATEYEVFVSRARSFTDVDRVLDQIERYRALPDEIQALLVQTCSPYKLPGIRRSSIHNTIRLNRPYALRMFALSRLLEIKDGGLARIIHQA